MIFLIYLFSIALVASGLTLVVKPDWVFRYLTSSSQSFGLYLAAIAIRVVFGGVLVFSASLSKFPLAIAILGWATIMAGLAVLIMGWRRFRILVKWVLVTAQGWGRLGGVFSTGLGIFLIYAFA